MIITVNYLNFSAGGSERWRTAGFGGWCFPDQWLEQRSRWASVTSANKSWSTGLLSGGQHSILCDYHKIIHFQENVLTQETKSVPSLVRTSSLPTLEPMSTPVQHDVALFLNLSIDSSIYRIYHAMKKSRRRFRISRRRWILRTNRNR